MKTQKVLKNNKGFRKSYWGMLRVSYEDGIIIVRRDLMMGIHPKAEKCLAEMQVDGR